MARRSQRSFRGARIPLPARGSIRRRSPSSRCWLRHRVWCGGLRQRRCAVGARNRLRSVEHLVCAPPFLPSGDLVSQGRLRATCAAGSIARSRLQFQRSRAPRTSQRVPRRGLQRSRSWWCGSPRRSSDHHGRCAGAKPRYSLSPLQSHPVRVGRAPLAFSMVGHPLPPSLRRIWSGSGLQIAVPIEACARRLLTFRRHGCRGLPHVPDHSRLCRPADRAVDSRAGCHVNRGSPFRDVLGAFEPKVALSSEAGGPLLQSPRGERGPVR